MEIEITPEALTQIAELPKAIRARINSVVDRLKNWPQVSGVKWMTADWKGHGRIRTGDYRLIFKVVESERVIVVVRIAHRKDSYAE